MSKPTILSMNRNEQRIDLTFERNVEFIDLYLHLLDFLKIDVYDEFYTYRDKEGKIDRNYLFEKKEEILDWYKKEFTFEIFFGHKKIIAVFESDKELNQKFIDEVYSNAEWCDSK